MYLITPLEKKRFFKKNYSSSLEITFYMGEIHLPELIIVVKNMEFFHIPSCSHMLTPGAWVRSPIKPLWSERGRRESITEKEMISQQLKRKPKASIPEFDHPSSQQISEVPMAASCLHANFQQIRKVYLILNSLLSYFRKLSYAFTF